MKLKDFWYWWKSNLPKITKAGIRQSYIDLRKLFITGFIALLPMVLTLYTISIFFSFADKIPRELTARFIKFFLGFFHITITKEEANVPGLGILTSLLLVFIVGYISTRFIGKQVWRSIETWLLKIPLAGNIYTAFKQILNTLFTQKKKAFREVALVQYPYKGCYTIGFVTSDAALEIQEKMGERMVSVFIPTTPNPTSGFMLILKEKEICKLEMSIEEAIKLVVSGGILIPEHKENQ